MPSFIVTPEHIATIMKERVDIQVNKVEEPTPHIVATAWLDNSYLLATAFSKAIDPSQFSYVKGVDYATSEVIEKAEEMLWSLEGYVAYNENKTESEIKAVAADADSVIAPYSPKPDIHFLAHLATSKHVDSELKELCTETLMREILQHYPNVKAKPVLTGDDFPTN